MEIAIGIVIGWVLIPVIIFLFHCWCYIMGQCH